MATRDAGTCECPSEDLQTAHTDRGSLLCALTNIANVNAFGAIDAGGGFEWKRHANWSLWVGHDHIFRRSDMLIYAASVEVRRSTGSSGAISTRCCSASMIVSAARRSHATDSSSHLVDSRICFGKQKPWINRGFFYSTLEFRRLLPSRHGNRLRTMLALICGSDPGRRCEDMKRWLVSAVAALMALLPVPPPSVVARARVPARSARGSRRWI
jgi:hypothetical protein